MWRRTIGRFRSEEAVYKSAERQYQTLAETLDGQVGLMLVVANPLAHRR